MATSHPDAPTQPLRGKTAVVTGATDGIGRVTAERLARLGAVLWIVGRNPQKCEKVANELRQIDGVEPQSVVYRVADLSLLENVRALGEQLRRELPRIDILVNNAGAMFLKREETAEGIEKTFALNHLAYFVLTNLLIDALRTADDSRIISVASDAHRNARGLNFEDLQSTDRYSGWGAYCRSKLANVLFTRELARRLKGSAVTANCLHPGFVRTSFFRWGGMAEFVTNAFASVAAISPEKGAQTSVYLASAPEVTGLSGRYFSKCRAVEPSAPARDDAAAQRLWERSEELTGVAFPV